jgi:hypothetical protein
MTEGPQPPSSANRGTSNLRPEEWNPEFAKAALARVFYTALQPFMIVSKLFVVFFGIWKGLNHSPTNRTGYDCSLRVAIFTNVGMASPNIDGRSFDSIDKYVSSASITVNQLTPSMVGNFEEQPSLGRRILNKFTGGGNNGQPNNPQ